MVHLDDTDLEILRLLVEDGRRAFSDIAEQVGVSGPTVSDRVDRLTEEGVIKRFTVELDHEQLVEGVGLLIEVDVTPGGGARVLDGVRQLPGVEHVFLTVDERVMAFARMSPSDVRDALHNHVDAALIDEISISVIDRLAWSPSFEAVGFDVECAECGNPVTDDGRSVVLDGERYLFCCPSCEDRFISRYERLSESA